MIDDDKIAIHYQNAIVTDEFTSVFLKNIACKICTEIGDPKKLIHCHECGIHVCFPCWDRMRRP